MRSPFFSILVPAYNATDTLAETLDSLAAQTFADWEVVVVDDGSTDTTFELCCEYATRDSRFRAFHQSNGGTAHALNAAAHASRGQWLVPLGADDALVVNALALQHEVVLKHPGCGLFTWSWHQVFEEVAMEASRGWPTGDCAEERDLANALRQDSPGSPIFERELFFATGGYRRLYAEDYDLMLRMLATGARWIHNCSELYVYRRSIHSKSNTLRPQLQSVLEVYGLFIDENKLDDKTRSMVDRAQADHRAELARVEFRERLATGEMRGMRRIFMRGLRFKSWSDRWIWALPIALLSPRMLRWFMSNSDRRRGTD